MIMRFTHIVEVEKFAHVLFCEQVCAWYNLCKLFLCHQWEADEPDGVPEDSPLLLAGGFSFCFIALVFNPTIHSLENLDLVRSERIPLENILQQVVTDIKKRFGLHGFLGGLVDCFPALLDQSSLSVRLSSRQDSEHVIGVEVLLQKSCALLGQGGNHVLFCEVQHLDNVASGELGLVAVDEAKQFQKTVGVAVGELDSSGRVGHVSVKHGEEDRTADGQHVLVGGNEQRRLLLVGAGVVNGEGDVADQGVVEHVLVPLLEGALGDLPVRVGRLCHVETTVEIPLKPALLLIAPTPW